jgi:uncharacterized RDD family membrane protein YckC
VTETLGRPAFASFFGRLAAGLVDWLIVYFGVWFAFIVQSILEEDSSTPLSTVLTGALGTLLPLLYFAVPWTRSGRTVGMRTNHITLVSERTRKPPGLARASLRALVAVITYAAFWFPIIVLFSDASVDAWAYTMIGVALTIVALALVGHLWALFDPQRRSLQDRLFGLTVVRVHHPSEERSPAAAVGT